VADTSRGAKLLQQAARRPDGEALLKLARAVCLAVFVEPGLLRQARVRLVPGVDAGTESDLWFSPLVLTRNVTGIVLDPDVLAVLRHQLATGVEATDFTNRAHDLVERLHAGHPPALQLEEEVVWEAIRQGSTAGPRIEAQLRTAVKAMATDADGGWDVARWAAQAWRRLPDIATRTEAGQLLAVGSSVRLGTATSVAGFGDRRMPTSLSWLMPSGADEPMLLGVELAVDGLRFIKPAVDGLVLQLPRTSPLVLEVSWHDGTTSHSKVVTVAPGVNLVLGSVVGQVTLRTLTGRRYLIEPEAAEAPSQAVDASWSGSRPRVVNPPPVTPPTGFQDRFVETRLIEEFLRDDRIRMFTVVGRGGIGKTALVCRLLRAREGGQLPDDLLPLAVDGIVYLGLSSGQEVTFPNLFTDLCRLLPESTAQRLEQLLEDSQQTPRELMLLLLEALSPHQVVALLDGVEALVDPETLEITDGALDEALRTLLTAPRHSLKVILTTRVAPRQLQLVEPARQRRLDMDEGLSSPYAEQLLRLMDPDGSLGLRDAPAELLTAARVRTGGYPRALEALVAVLAADRGMSLQRLLAEIEGIPPEDIVEALDGEAFNRLDPVALQVMQALAIYGLPVWPVAVDFLLKPYRPALDSGPTLDRLVNMQFVRGDAGRYYLRQVDRDYALSRIPAGRHSDSDATDPPFTRYALRHRGAEYFRRVRTPHETWKQVDNLAPQLAEFELRCQNEEYETAASVLSEIDAAYLLRWGQYRLVVKLHERLQGKLTDPSITLTSTVALGTALRMMGQYRRATERYEVALSLARAHGHRQAVGALLGDLGDCSASLGDFSRAISQIEQALAIAREVGDQLAEGTQLHNLGGCYASVGEVRRASDLYEWALTIARRVSNRQGEASSLIGLGDGHADGEAWELAVQCYEQAVQIADGLGFRHGQVQGRLVLAKAHLIQGELSAARAAAEAAHAQDEPLDNGDAAALLGLVLLRQQAPGEARMAFSEAVAHTGVLLEHAPENYHALDTKALALCGLTLLGDAARLPEAMAAVEAARAVTVAAGVVRDAVRLLDALVVVDQGDVLGPVRARAAAQAPEPPPAEPEGSRQDPGGGRVVVLDRVALKNAIRRMTEESSQIRILAVDGPPGSGKSFTSQIVQQVAAETQAFRVAYVNFDQHPLLGPVELAEELASQLGRSLESIPQPQATTARVVHELANWLMAQVEASDRHWWWILDGPSSVTAMNLDTHDLVRALVERVQRPSVQLRLVLLGFDEQFPPHVEPFVYREELASIGGPEIRDYLVDLLRRVGREMDAGQIDAATQTVLDGLPAGRDRLRTLSARMSQVAEAVSQPVAY
jgi:tetratricopeptide (TPR) repeat protein